MGKTRFDNLPREYSVIPQVTIDALARYVEEGIPPGGFLTAALENNLKESFARADDGNIQAMFKIVHLLYNHIPGNCWGSPERVEEWLIAKKEEV